MKNQYKFYVRGQIESLKRQMKVLNKFCDSIDVVSANLFVDIYTQKEKRYFERDKMLNSLTKGDVILVTTLDRLSRNVNELREISKKIEEVGAELIVVEQQNPMLNLFMKEISKKMYERTLESTEIENSVRRKIDNPSLERLYDNLYKAISNHYDEVNKNEK